MILFDVCIYSLLYAVGLTAGLQLWTSEDMVMDFKLLF